MEIFKLFGSILIKSEEADESMHKTESKAKKLASTLGKGIKTAAKWGGGLIASAAGAATAVVGSLLKIDEATKEYRESMGKLSTAWEAAGSDAKTAQTAYEGLYGVIGDKGTATEAAQLLAKVAHSTQDVAKWTDIAAGVSGTFGEALPINSLVEAVNETQKTGEVTGALADALNWAGISEDDFNKKLEACGSEQERNALITETLSTTYQGATDAFKANNAEVIAAREAQNRLDAAMAKLGGAVETVKVQLLGEFAPAIADIVSAFVDFTQGVDGAEDQLQHSVQAMVDKIVQRLPDFLSFGVDIIVAIAKGLIRNLPYLLSQIPGMIGQILNAFGELGGELWDVGKEAIGKLLDGAKAKWGEVKEWFSEKARWLGDKLAFWRRGKAEMEDDPKPRPRGHGFRPSPQKPPHYPHAAGLAYVPYDGYKAELHKGERVLDAAEAEQYRKQQAPVVLAQPEQPITVNVVLDGEVISRKTYKAQKKEEARRGPSLVMV